MNIPTVKKLEDMKLKVMSERFIEQSRDPKILTMSFDDRFDMLVESEFDARKNNKVSRLIRKANFPDANANIESIEYHIDRELNRDLIQRLAISDYIQTKQNIILLGATGTGKTFLSCAFGMAATRSFYSVKYVRLPDLINELSFANLTHTYLKTINLYKKINLLIIDEWVLYDMKQIEVKELLEIMETRYKKSSTIISSQYPINTWSHRLGNTPLAEAIVDRLVHNAHIITIKGDISMRERIK
jgi:DNA replication protein DnaC